jgi:betaine-aldehyde dehydrogenase
VVGDGLAPDTEMGPLITPQHMERVLGYIDAGKKEGAQLLCGGARLTDGKRAKGNFVAPTIFAQTRPDMRIVREEIFGPVLAVQLFDAKTTPCAWPTTLPMASLAASSPATKAKASAC